MIILKSNIRIRLAPSLWYPTDRYLCTIGKVSSHYYEPSSAAVLIKAFNKISKKNKVAIYSNVFK